MNNVCSKKQELIVEMMVINVGQNRLILLWNLVSSSNCQKKCKIKNHVITQFYFKRKFTFKTYIKKTVARVL